MLVAAHGEAVIFCREVGSARRAEPVSAKKSLLSSAKVPSGGRNLLKTHNLGVCLLLFRDGAEGFFVVAHELGQEARVVVLVFELLERERPLADDPVKPFDVAVVGGVVPPVGIDHGESMLQFSTTRPETRENSSALAVAKTAPSDNA